MKLKLLNYIISIEKINILGITEQISYADESEPWSLEWDVDKRINVMCKNHGFIEYIFRDFDVALFTYHEYAVQLLYDVSHTLGKIRNKLKLNGASNEQLTVYDEKILSCFEKTLRIINDRYILEKLPEDKELLNVLGEFNIELMVKKYWRHK